MRDCAEHYLQAVSVACGAVHFNVADLFRAAYPEKHWSCVILEQQHLKLVMSRIVRDGLASLSAGPRGGAGWTLTELGLDLGLKLSCAALAPEHVSLAVAGSCAG